jgi:type I restriction enzyme S subunit
LAEQGKIVEILEEQLSRLDAALASVRAVREKATQFRRSLLHAAFTGALTGPSPNMWGYSALRDVAILSLGKMLDRKKDDGSNSTKYLRNINVRWGEIETDDLLEMGIKPEQLDRVSLRNGDVVVCEGGEPGRAAIWTGGESIAIQKALHRVRPHEHVEPRFLYYFLESEFRGVENHPLFTGTTIKHLPKEKIATLRVPLPSAVQQREIVDTVDEHLTRFDASLTIAVAVEKRAAALRRSLLHAAFTGTLTEQWRKDSHV